MDIDGGNPKQLTNDGGFFPDVLPDGRWVIILCCFDIVPFVRLHLFKSAA
jgi:hypothetical protein